ncbi:unnamed protein product [Penicillium roqueforti FM164]|uniref:Genomic scaffold, ProqFM164S02 n=1 Tax=Penicillium roqueforti (strain FM164) TaxID=1365484 RepID=W6Q3V6_PENRF|nr:unnamed protein product [Penicillium roqueforti FM164]
MLLRVLQHSTRSSTCNYARTTTHWPTINGESELQSLHNVIELFDPKESVLAVLNEPETLDARFLAPGPRERLSRSQLTQPVTVTSASDSRATDRGSACSMQIEGEASHISLRTRCFVNSLFWGWGKALMLGNFPVYIYEPGLVRFQLVTISSISW